MSLGYGAIPCSPEDAGYVLTTLSRLSDLFEDFGWREGEVFWVLSVAPDERQAAHLMIKNKAQRAISEHRAVQ